jgi:hypothetical protein
MVSRSVFGRLARRHNGLALKGGQSDSFVFKRVDTKTTLVLSGIFNEDNQSAFGIQGGIQQEDRTAQIVVDETTLLAFLADRTPKPEVWETDSLIENLGANQTEWIVKSSLSDRFGCITLFLRKEANRAYYAPEVRG